MTSEHKRQILVIDDKQSFYDNLFKLNPDWVRFQAENESSAKGMLEAKASELDLVLFDLNLEYDSYEHGLVFLEKLRSLNNIQFDHLPFVIVSSDDRQDTYLKALNAGASGLLFKGSYEQKAWRDEILEIIRCRKTLPRFDDEIVYPYLPLQNAYTKLNALKSGHQGDNFSVVLQGEPGLGKYQLRPLLPDTVEQFNPNDSGQSRKMLEKLYDGDPVILITQKRLIEWYHANKISHLLYERLNNLPILDIPPLRENPEALLPLIDYFLRQPNVCPVHKETFFGKKALDIFNREAVALLESYQWEFNIRELREVIQRILYWADIKKTSTITSRDLLNWVPRLSIGTHVSAGHGLTSSEQEAYRELIFIDKELSRNGQNTESLARLKGWSLEQLRQRVKKHHVEFPGLFKDMKLVCDVFNLERGYSKPVRIMVCCASENKDLLHQFLKQFKVIENKYPVVLNNNIDFKPGFKYEIIRNDIEKSDILIAFVCADLLAYEDYNSYLSEYLLQYKMKTDYRLIIPVLAKSCPWQHTHFKDFNVLPRDQTPILEHPQSLDQNLKMITDEIKKVLDTFKP